MTGPASDEARALSDAAARLATIRIASTRATDALLVALADVVVHYVRWQVARAYPPPVA